MMADLDKAIALACKVHTAQVDKSGEPYILHPLRLMLKFANNDERIVGVLHDVVEDSEVTLDDLRKIGFNELIVQAVDSLSKRKDESYENFIERIKVNRLAKKVKIEDIKDNLDLTRLHSISSNDLDRIEKYHKALTYLLEGNFI
jgi:(p)ppGpp synthase/HD superfamily hydrolase